MVTWTWLASRPVKTRERNQTKPRRKGHLVLTSARDSSKSRESQGQQEREEETASCRHLEETAPLQPMAVSYFPGVSVEERERGAEARWQQSQTLNGQQ